MIGTALLLRSLWTAPLAISAEGYRLTIAEGSSLSRISQNLHEDGVLKHPGMFNLVARLQGADARIRRGEYDIPLNSTAADLLNLIQSGETVRYLVTIPEGIRLADAIVIVHEAEGITPILESDKDPKLFAAFPESPFVEGSLEGMFLAETYQYERGSSDLDILRQAYKLAASTLERAWQQRASDLPYACAEEALIMASIIEKETAVPDERPIIAGVFTRRLQRGMRLQTDPTVIYGLGADFDGNLTRAHLRDESNLFNTYRHSGLPPGPIALPGRASIEAALHPAPGDELYFVARGDGSHAFNATLEDHEADVRRFQLQRRNEYRSTPQRPQ